MTCYKDQSRNWEVNYVWYLYEFHFGVVLITFKDRIRPCSSVWEDSLARITAKLQLKSQSRRTELYACYFVSIFVRPSCDPQRISDLSPEIFVTWYSLCDVLITLSNKSTSKTILM